MRFLGIDLGWSSGASGLCCLAWEGNALVLLDLDHKQPTEAILTWVDTWAGGEQPAAVAVDAPTIIPNATGMRLPDRLTHRYFHRYHAGCYPANLGRPFAARTVEFGQELFRRKFRHGIEIKPQKPDRWQIEVFPHPAMVHLFNLDKILKYKKGAIAERCQELNKLRTLLLTLTAGEPRLKVANLPDIPEKTSALKSVEDQLDALMCAYVAAYWWYWGEAKNQVLGNEQEGYIVVPHRRVQA
ncbi:hypothetical protein GlitD10_1862 [Gloeomargarita lithophora Alchichica-D10]|uniref:DUF429 domain-containing protein n=1 Tax=Gloeomargarita lithophora Alchichica-D10 TaxID=1188229 RepID=A0A1J0AE25_9CYAN|nr:DUF429 domain-containing protein [Gloeomargarita lithophora]APB34188.1 hypothetical protein GlitD10_1862 [Gloeomargarita lithophora Alchichica-D10]